MPKKGIYEKIKVWTFSCLLLGFVSSLLGVCGKYVACKSSHNIFYQEKLSALIWHVQCNLQVTSTLCYRLSIVCNLLHHVYSNSWVLDTGGHWQNFRKPHARKYRVDFIQDTYVLHFFRYTIASSKCKFGNYIQCMVLFKLWYLLLFRYKVA
jgi:hypothetical protein